MREDHELDTAALRALERFQNSVTNRSHCVPVGGLPASARRFVKIHLDCRGKTLVVGPVSNSLLKESRQLPPLSRAQ